MIINITSREGERVSGFNPPPPLRTTTGYMFHADSFIPIVPAGITSIGVHGKDSVCVVTQKKNIPDTASEMINRSHFVPVAKHLALLITCPTANVRKVANSAKNEVYNFRFRNRYEITVEELAKWIYRYRIPRTPRDPNIDRWFSDFSAVGMVFGIDEEKGPQLFKCVLPIHFSGHKATSLGLKEKEAISFLEKEMKIYPAFSYEETVQAAISAMKSVLQEEFKAAEIEVGVVRADNPDFMVLSTEEIDEHLNAISERNLCSRLGSVTVIEER